MKDGSYGACPTNGPLPCRLVTSNSSPYHGSHCDTAAVMSLQKYERSRLDDVTD